MEQQLQCWCWTCAAAAVAEHAHNNITCSLLALCNERNARRIPYFHHAAWMHQQPQKLEQPHVTACNRRCLRPFLPFAWPGADLEQRMRATLGALASFNEDERMLLLRCTNSPQQRALTSHACGNALLCPAQPALAQYSRARMSKCCC